MSTPPVACVVVPARDEEALIGDCLAALATQEVAAPFDVLVVLDGCTDRTEPVARSVAACHPTLRLTILALDGEGVGAARRLGMDVACRRLLAARRGHGLIATTDADSTVGCGWVRAQLDAIAHGAEAIGGRIELSTVDAARLPAGVIAGRRALQRLRLGTVREREPGAAHWQFSGASMGVTARTYARVGGIEPLAALEDEAFEARLCGHGVPILRSTDVRVATSARLEGRAPAGLACDLRALSRSLSPTSP